MSISFKAKYYAIVGCQLLVLTGLIAQKQVTLITGTTVLLKTVPVDPRDMFRGDYVTLNYDMSRLERWQFGGETFRKGDSAYVVLQADGRYWRATRASHTPPSDGTLFIAGRVTRASSDSMSVEYGIESYFVPEGKGRDLERAAGHGLVVEAAIDRRGHAAIRGVKVLPEAEVR
jgi:uncharacterized membrane-anchored protein